MDQPPPRQPAVACVALYAGMVLVLLDLILLRGRPLPLPATAAAVVLFSSALVAVSARLALALTALAGGGRWRRSLVGAALALLVIVPVAVLLFQGTGIRGRWYAPYGPYGVVPLLFGLTVLGLRSISGLARWARTLSRRWVLAPPTLGLTGVLLWADHRLYPNQYGYLHWVLLLCTFLGLSGSIWLLCPRREVKWTCWPCRLLLAASVPAFVLTGILGLESHHQRQVLDERTHSSGRLVAVYRWLLDWDGDRHSIIFGEQDCDNLDPAVHPFAAEIPENGIDEDCDGRDAKAPRPAAARPAELDVEGYRRRVQTWLREPALARRLGKLAGANVVLVVLDALRQDQVTPTPANRNNHPNLMALLAESRHFTRAFSLGAGTDIGMAGIFTGQLDPFAEDNRTLLAAFKEGGFETHGVFQREVSRWLGRQFSLEGLGGRKVVVNDPHRRDLGSRATSRQVTDEGIRYLRQAASRRFFLWLHYFDIHEHHQIDHRTLGMKEVSPGKGLPDYRLMIRHVDRHLGRFLDALKAEGLWEQTIVALVADHGEGLATSPRLPQNHGDVLYNPLVHVPMAFRIPNLPGEAIPMPVSLLDLLPTLLDLVRLPRAATEGVSLAPLLLGVHRAETLRLRRPLFMIEAKQHGVVRWPWKFLARQDQGLVELYHLERDFGEERNLADTQPAVARELSRVLHSRKLITIDRLKWKRR